MKPIHLPKPPSVDECTGNNKTGKGKGRYNTKVYRAWIKEAGWVLIIQKPGKIQGNFKARIIIDETQRGESDIDNYTKPLLDLMQKHGIVTNDKLCDGESTDWGFAPQGCTITLIEREQFNQK